MHERNDSFKRRPGTIGMARPPKTAKPKLWSHQDDLLAMRGRLVQVTYLDGQRHTAKLLEADQFALKLEDEDGYTHIIWKHDLSGVAPMPSGAN